MTTTVLAISRQFGAGGSYIGRAVAQRLGLKYADREILAEAARALQMETDDLAPMEERVQGFWERLARMFSIGPVDGPYMPPPLQTVSETDLLTAEQQIIETLAAEGNAVIVGRGAAHLLRERAGVLRVFLHAPFSSRVVLAMKEYDLSVPGEAAEIVRLSDAKRARFARTVSNHDWYDATLYDLSLNTATTGLDGAVDLVVAALRLNVSTG